MKRLLWIFLCLPACCLAQSTPSSTYCNPAIPSYLYNNHFYICANGSPLQVDAGGFYLPLSGGVLTGPLSTTQSTAPTVSSNAGTGSLTHGTDMAGIIATGVASTATTLTFNVGWANWSSCTVSGSLSTALPFVSAISKSAVTFTYVTTGTPVLYYVCLGG